MEILIAGAGIGGLSAALFLHQKGHRVHLFDSVAALRELGVGINIQPHAVRELDKIGLKERLAAVGNPCIEWGMFNKFGQTIWREPRGLAAGHGWPQISVHRGRLQAVLHDAVKERLGAGAVATDHRLVSFEERNGRVTARFATGSTAEGDVLIGADGIHSTVRRTLHPNEGDPIYNGAILWRGLARWPSYLTGGTQCFIGHPDQKFIVYPIEPPGADGTQLTNWICQVTTPAMKNREDWNREGRFEDFLPQYEDWDFDWLDVPAMIRSTATVFEFPMVDRDPLPRWSFGRVTLLGDAAHPMVPIGANGGSQAIRDASAIADAFAAHADPIEALATYEQERRSTTAEIVLSNRQLGPEEVMKMAHERAPHGFVRIEEVIPHAELEAVSQRYRSVTWASPTPLGKSAIPPHIDRRPGGLR
jgi:2-polyprenyl-6-methoxyphenol hydroxylase-like FAD-dependent oxidoreductase